MITVPTKKGLSVGESTLLDAAKLSITLRPADLAEIKAHSGRHPFDVLHAGVMASNPCYTVRDSKGRPLAMLGAIPGDNGAVVWMLGTEDLFTGYRLDFVRYSKGWLNHLLDRFGRLYNVIDARNTVHIRWLEWLGFELSEPFPYGVEGKPFHFFEKKLCVNQQQLPS